MDDRRVGAAADDRSEAVAQTPRVATAECGGLRGHVELGGVLVDVRLQPRTHRGESRRPGEKVAHGDGVAEKSVADVADFCFVFDRLHARYGTGRESNSIEYLKVVSGLRPSNREKTAKLTSEALKQISSAASLFCFAIASMKGRNASYSRICTPFFSNSAVCSMESRFG